MSENVLRVLFKSFRFTRRKIFSPLQLIMIRWNSICGEGVKEFTHSYYIAFLAKYICLLITSITNRKLASWCKACGTRCLFFCWIAFVLVMEILPSVWCNFSNLLKHKQSSRNTSIVLRTRRNKSIWITLKLNFSQKSFICEQYAASPLDGYGKLFVNKKLHRIE